MREMLIVALMSLGMSIVCLGETSFVFLRPFFTYAICSYPSTLYFPLTLLTMPSTHVLLTPAIVSRSLAYVTATSLMTPINISTPTVFL